MAITGKRSRLRSLSTTLSKDGKKKTSSLSTTSGKDEQKKTSSLSATSSKDGQKKTSSLSTTLSKDGQKKMGSSREITLEEESTPEKIGGEMSSEEDIPKKQKKQPHKKEMNATYDEMIAEAINSAFMQGITMSGIREFIEENYEIPSDLKHGPKLSQLLANGVTNGNFTRFLDKGKQMKYVLAKSADEILQPSTVPQPQRRWSEGSTSGSKVGTHPPYMQMILEAIFDMADRQGSTGIAILKYIREHFAISDNPATTKYLWRRLEDGVKSGEIERSSGMGPMARYIPSMEWLTAQRFSQ
ncbi:unnamed protein product, partial [Mesorhabditis belari]|uniref:H15 domain-containing protein n=1 Tax=Mesorhabditis belari TaxID=2138241 RepID=A0AAF3EDT0_9BILA